MVRNLFVTNIAADLNGNPANGELVSSNLVTGTAVSTVLKSSDVSTQTDVWYTDNVVALKVCTRRGLPARLPAPLVSSTPSR